MRLLYVLIMTGIMIFTLIGCAIGHDDYVSYLNDSIGSEMPYKEPFQSDDAGKLIRSDYLIGGKGLTHISMNESGSLIYHFSFQEVLPNIQPKDWVGKCLIYYVVEPQTNIITDWGFDEGSNPLSCRTWL